MQICHCLDDYEGDANEVKLFLGQVLCLASRIGKVIRNIHISEICLDL